MYIMDLVTEMSPSVQDKINNVRKYLNIVAIADVMDVTGLKVNRMFCKKLRTKFSRESKLCWPPYIDPPEGHWREWGKHLIPKISKLKLGRWFKGKHHHKWDFIQITPEHALHISKTGPKLYKRDLLFTAPFFLISSDPIPAHQFNSKVSTIREGNYIIITRNITSKSVVPRVRIKVPYKPSIDSATGVSDGSVKNNIGSYGWVLESDYRKITGGGLVPQSHNEMDSQRAELYGIMNLVESVIRRFQPT